MSIAQLTEIAAIVAAISAVLGQVILIMKQYEATGILKTVHQQTNSINANLQGQVNTLQTTQATPQEIASRPVVVPPPGP